MNEPFDNKDAAGDISIDVRKEPLGVAYLDVLFQENPKVDTPTLTDLTGDGDCLEITVVYPISYLAWYESILSEVKSENAVLGFLGRTSDSVSLNPDALGRLSDGRFEYVSLSTKASKIAPLSVEQRKRLLGAGQ